MGRNLPELSPRERREAPWNQPGIDEHFPVVCRECGFKARNVEDLADHEHDEVMFEDPEPKHTQKEPEEFDHPEMPLPERYKEEYEQ